MAESSAQVGTAIAVTVSCRAQRPRARNRSWYGILRRWRRKRDNPR